MHETIAIPARHRTCSGIIQISKGERAHPQTYRFPSNCKRKRRPKKDAAKVKSCKSDIMKLGYRLDTLGATVGALWRHRALSGRHFGHPRHPSGTIWTHLGAHFCHLGNVSPKRSEKPLCLITFLTSFREGCTCYLTTPVQSKHTFGHYF